VSDEFRRLLEDRAGSPLHSVLEAGLRDQPSRRQLTQGARALGIGAAGLGAAQAAAAAAGSARAVQASLFTSLAKWGATGLLLGGVALSPLLRDSSPNPPSSPRQASSRRAVTSARVATQVLDSPPPTASSGRGTATTPSPPPSVTPAAPQRAAHVEPVAAQQAPTGRFQALGEAPASAPFAAGRHDLDAEVTLLDAARSALKRGDPNRALTWLDRHSGLEAPVLADEATLLRVQALVAAGRSTEARSVVQRAGGSANSSAYAQRLRKLVGVAAER